MRSKVRPEAEVDLELSAGYLWDAEGEALAMRFIKAVRATIDRIAAMPGIGSPVEYRRRRFKYLRFITVRGFRKYLVFYRERTDHVEVVRILYGRRDVPQLLADEGNV